MKVSLTSKFITGVMLALLIVHACKHPKGEELPQPVNPNPTVNVNTNLYDSICFEEQILPILVSNCAKSGCHNDTTRHSGIVVTSYESVMSTLSPELLIQCIQDSGQLGMPRSGKLNSTQVNLILTWIGQGMKKGIDCEGPCDTSHITYSGTIFPIITNNCLGCHTNSTTILNSYSNIKELVANGKLNCTINHLSGCQPMPQGGGQLAPCKLKQIKIWIDSGAPNN